MFHCTRRTRQPQLRRPTIHDRFIHPSIHSLVLRFVHSCIHWSASTHSAIHPSLRSFSSSITVLISSPRRYHEEDGHERGPVPGLLPVCLWGVDREQPDTGDERVLDPNALTQGQKRKATEETGGRSGHTETVWWRKCVQIISHRHVSVYWEIYCA